jgi:NADPH:quinone reductase-like Zn-dependent oxidoreductase
MKAVVYRQFGLPEVVQVEETPQPAPRRDEVLIAVHASTVSTADAPVPARFPVVEAVGGSVTMFKPGDEVISMLGAKFGRHGRYVCVPESGAITAEPHNMAFEEAVTLVFARDHSSRHPGSGGDQTRERRARQRRVGGSRDGRSSARQTTGCARDRREQSCQR